MPNPVSDRAAWSRTWGRCATVTCDTAAGVHEADGDGIAAGHAGTPLQDAEAPKRGRQDMVAANGDEASRTVEGCAGYNGAGSALLRSREAVKPRAEGNGAGVIRDWFGEKTVDENDEAAA